MVLNKWKIKLHAIFRQSILNFWWEPLDVLLKRCTVKISIRKVWTPPAAVSNNDVGYGVLPWPLIWASSTKGTNSYQSWLQRRLSSSYSSPQRCWDSTNGRCRSQPCAAADGLEEFEVVEVDPMDRNSYSRPSPFKDGLNSPWWPKWRL